MAGPGNPTGATGRHNSAEERAAHVERIEAFKQGVMETSGVPIIFVDPENIRDFDVRFSLHPPFNRGQEYSLRDQMERQVPGSMDALEDVFSDGGSHPVNMDNVARALRIIDVSAISHLNVDGTEYGLVVLPNSERETKEGLVSTFFRRADPETRAAIVRSMPGTDAQWMHFVGNHEGEHLNQEGRTNRELDTLIAETGADRSAYQLAVARGDTDVAEAFRDLRALAIFYDYEHATSALIDSDATVSVLHLEAAKGTSQGRMSSLVRDHFDFTTYAGSATTPDELLKEDPDAYFQALDRGLQAMQQRAVAAYEADPQSRFTQRDVLFAQIQTNYCHDFEDAYRRRALGQEVEAREPTRLIAQEVEDAYFAESEYLDRRANETGTVRAESQAAFPAARALEDVDWSSVGPGYADAAAFLVADPVGYYELVAQKYDVLKEQALADYRADPSFENLQRAVQLQEVIFNNSNQLITARAIAIPPAERKAEDFQPPAYDTVISMDEVRAYYEERFARMDAGTWTPPEPYNVSGAEDGAPLEQGAPNIQHLQHAGLDGTAFTTRVRGLTAGEPVVAEDGSGVFVGGVSMPLVYAQSARPDPQNVSLVNALEGAPDEAADKATLDRSGAGVTVRV